MIVVRNALADCLLLEPEVFADERGFFLETYNARRMAEIGIRSAFVQDNHSRSKKNVLRGLHYQVAHAQGKLVRVVCGEVFDVAVDLRRSSQYFGHWAGVKLSAGNQQMFWVPPGFAHGFLVLSEMADVVYKVTDFYSPSDERTIVWNDQELKINWPIQGVPIVSKKDRNGVRLMNADTFL